MEEKPFTKSKSDISSLLITVGVIATVIGILTGSGLSVLGVVCLLVGVVLLIKNKKK